MVWLSGRCCRTEHASPMSDGIQMKIQKGQEMLKKIKRRDSKIKRKRNMETRIYPDPAEFDRSVVHAFI